MSAENNKLLEAVAQETVAKDIATQENELKDIKKGCETIGDTSGFDSLMCNFARVFRAFDRHDAGVLKRSDVGYILRYLNFQPTQEQLEFELETHILTSVENQNHVEKEVLWKRIIQLWKLEKYPRIRDDELLRAFQVFDRELNNGEILGWLPCEAFKTLIQDIFSEDQIESFMNVAGDENEDGKKVIFYEDYVDELCEGVY